MNEPAGVAPQVYAAVVRKLVATIRREDPQRLIIADGLQWGNVPVPKLRDLHIAQATRGDAPMEISHYKASRRVERRRREPGDRRHGRRIGRLQPDAADVVLRWAEDAGQLEEGRLGLGHVELRGSMGVIDSGRSDIGYEDYEGHKLDRKLMDLLQRY